MRPSEDISSKDQSSVLNATALMQVMANMYEKKWTEGILHNQAGGLYIWWYIFFLFYNLAKVSYTTKSKMNMIKSHYTKIVSHNQKDEKLSTWEQEKNEFLI